MEIVFVNKLLLLVSEFNYLLFIIIITNPFRSGRALRYTWWKLSHQSPDPYARDHCLFLVHWFPRINSGAELLIVLHAKSKRTLLTPFSEFILALKCPRFDLEHFNVGMQFFVPCGHLGDVALGSVLA